MNLNKTFGRVATALVAGAMLTALAMPAYAEQPDETVPTTPIIQGDPNAIEEGDSFYITKYLTKEEKTMTPNVEFKFEVNPVTGVNETRNGIPVSNGISSGVTADATDGTAKFAPNGTLDKNTKLSTQVKFNVNLDAFPEPGIYKYSIYEKDLNPSYGGITKDVNTLNLYVYIENDEENGGLKVAYTELVDPDAVKIPDEDTGKALKVDSFTNDYDSQGTALHDLTVYKVLTGNAATMTDTFDFTVKVDGENGEQYYVEFGTYEVPDDADASASPVFIVDQSKDPIVLTSGTPSAKFKLGNNQAFKVYGLDSNDAYTVTETTANQDGYSVKIDGGADEDGVTNGTINADKVVQFDNYKNASTPTGIVMNVAPYVLLVVVAAAGCFVFLRKRRED